MKRFLNEKGFTLIELLVVVAILGILAAVATPSLIGMIDEGNKTAAKIELASVQTAVDATIASAGVAGTDTTLAAGDDYTITVGAKTYRASDYLRGGLAGIKGQYNIDASGTVTPK